jgi:predicted O-methyltransferase YrrM
MNSTIRKLVPSSLNSAAKSALRRYRIWRGVRAILNLKRGELPTRKMLETLSLGWGNSGYAANVDYLHEVAKRAVVTEGPILECGSGLTTLLLGLLAGRRGVAIHSLEHSEKWQQRVSGVLAENQIMNVEVLSSPLRDYGDFSWYDPPLMNLPDSFRLVVCDGPPGMTKGGRYGLLPIFGERLKSGAVIVLDDANRPGELEMVHRWRTEVDLAVQGFNKPTGSFTTLVRRS